MVPSDLGVALVADHDELVALLGELGHLDMHLGHQRAGGVKDVKAARAASSCTALLTPWR